jgi:hypothetical protein
MGSAKPTTDPAIQFTCAAWLTLWLITLKYDVAIPAGKL